RTIDTLHPSGVTTDKTDNFASHDTTVKQLPSDIIGSHGATLLCQINGNFVTTARHLIPRKTDRRGQFDTIVKADNIDKSPTFGPPMINFVITLRIVTERIQDGINGFYGIIDTVVISATPGNFVT